MKKALLISSSGYKNTGYLNHCKDWIKDFLGKDKDEEILFIPFAGVRRNNDEYEKKVKDSLNMDNIKSIHRYENPKEAIKNAKVLSIGGGNTYVLLEYLYKYDLIEIIRQKIQNATPYFGWSAGAIIMTKNIKTTNDMPIVMPKSFDAINIFPHNINPHYIEGKMPNHNGESREERLEEFLIINQKSKVYAIPEGTALKILDNKAEVFGHNDIKELNYQQETKIIKVGDFIEF